MAVHEVVLRFEDGREELRYTDHVDRVNGDGKLVVLGHEWRIVETREADFPGGGERLICVPLAAQG